MMENFQLYRTNPLLSGQLKWDIVVESLQGNLYVSDFHLTPISENVSHTYKSDEYLVKNSHQDNVKEYYRTHKGEFYSNAIKSEFEHNWPMICKSGKYLDAYSNIYDRGCRRTKHYSKYKKQFEFLCPLWIEHLNGDLRFNITVMYANSNSVIASKTLKISKGSLSDFHNEFVDYYMDYMAYTKTDIGNDDLINIKLKDHTANITGLNALTGRIDTKTIQSLVENLMSRERPLIESDSMLINAFSDNYMICTQLQNFNLCFSLDDIMSNRIIKLMTGEDVKIVVDAYVGDKLLDKRDFYTEYEFIDREVLSSNENLTERRNALDYLHDFECVELIDKNKFCQSICHWSLNENNDYIFNVYDGFSGIYIDSNKDGTFKEYENSHQYGLAPNTQIENYSKSANNIGWINVYELNNWNAFYKYYNEPDKYKTNGSFIDENIRFINGIVYDTIKDCSEIKNTYIVGAVAVGNVFSNIISTLRNNLIEINEKLYLYKISEDLLMIISKDFDSLTYKNFNNAINSVDSEDILLKDLKTLLGGMISPTMLVFNESIKYSKANSPSSFTDEITYFKDRHYNYLFRYDGKIKPTFSTKPSSLYYKDYVSNDDDNSKFKLSPYYKYGNTGYEPTYPSIDFCPIRKIDNVEYGRMPDILVTEHEERIPIYSKPEYTWFDDNKYFVLLPSLKFYYSNTVEDGYESLDDIVKKLLKEYYNVSDEAIEHIKSLYVINNKWEYESITNIHDYKYEITLTLK